MDFLASQESFVSRVAAGSASVEEAFTNR